MGGGVLLAAYLLLLEPSSWLSYIEYMSMLVIAI